MNRQQRRVLQARQRTQDKRTEAGRKWAKMLIEQLVQASVGNEPNIEAGIVYGTEIRDLVPIFLPSAFFRSVILCRPITTDGIHVPFANAGTLASETGWRVVYDSLAFVIRGSFTSDIAEFKTAMMKLDYNSVIARAPPSPKYLGLCKFMIEELECEGFPFGFLSPFHPDPEVDIILREVESEVIEAFWAMTAAEKH
jgi:hypothetical protein